MTAKDRATLKAENSADFPDNTAGAISAADLRGQLDDIIDSATFPEDGGASAPALATQIVTVADATRTLSSADHNKILDCIHTAGCEVTVLGGLTSGIAGVPFTCGISKGASAGNVTVIAGTVVNAPNAFLTINAQFGLMTLTEWPDGTFRLYGGNAT
jgi:hypothetical protein